MVGPGGGGGGDSRSKEAEGMMALHEALRNVCLNSDWTYSVFWTIRPRPRCRGGNGCKVGDDNGSLMLMWEDGFCRPRSMAECVEEMEGDGLVRKAFSKMSIQLYNYGEGLMGKVASDKCHKWVFKEPSETEPNISNYWQSSFDAIPPEWTDQFASGIQTIAVIQAGHGLLQLGSCKIIPEDLHFVLRMRHMFESLGYQSGFYLSQLFSSAARTAATSATLPKQMPAARPPPPLYNSWNPHHRPHGAASAFNPMAAHMPMRSAGKEDLFHPLSGGPHHHNADMNEIMHEHDQDLKWPSGLSFFTALTGRGDDSKLLFGGASGNGMEDSDDTKPMSHHAQGSGCERSGAAAAEEYLSLDGKVKKADQNAKFKRSFTFPARMATNNSSPSASVADSPMGPSSHGGQGTGGGECRSSEAGIYSDIMETFLD